VICCQASASQARRSSLKNAWKQRKRWSTEYWVLVGEDVAHWLNALLAVSTIEPGS
jgi:hypothetical protein